ncbi:GNAT family N-acetyltransferase [Phaeobacter sp. QD34_3]|uniref:GNAT family N-acetyltransferase n=1 Tax=unclassified Phaeobacter TaxID=2621772 RepID=UPI00237F2C81|nr:MULTISPECIES: GNAT family N-acetyltransferase [unclassified Phaeobacter]MDE4134169.1 GNAT family N-acetyltransferase [Phaeobacter sp. QD34_3]MDE4137908.1 GNAT family N-acetyltransferase [Phaeobacter sp. QD34_24]
MFDFIPPVSATRPDTQGSLAQSEEFLRALRATGQDPLVLERMNNTVVLRQRLWGRLDVAMVNRARFEKPLRLLEILQEEGLRRTPVILSPEAPTPELAQHGALPLMGPASIARLDLSSSPERRRAALHQKWRNRLKHGESQGLRLTRQTMPFDANHWLFAADQAQQSKRGYRSWPLALTLAYGQANKGMAKLFQAFEGKDPVAAILVLRHGREASYHIAQTTRRGKALSAHNLLLWEAMSWLSAQGCKSLDLGVINTEDAPGLARFKLGTGAQLHRLGGTWLFWPPMGRLLAPLARLDRRMMGA